MYRQKFLIGLVAVTLTLQATFVQAKPRQTSRQSWLPFMPGLPSLTAIASQLPSMPSFSSIQTLFSPGGGGSMFGPALADFGSYLSDTMPAFGDVYSSIPSWEQLGEMLPNLPNPSSLYGQLPTEVQSSLQQMWAQTNPLDVDTYRRRQYQRGALMMLGLAGFYSGYQGRYKEYRKGLESYVEPHERKRKYSEMKRVCYYSLPKSKADNETLAPGDIKSGLCTHLVLNDATVSAESGAVTMSYDESDDGHLQEMMGKLKDAAPKMLLCVGGHSSGLATGDSMQHMAHSKKKRLRFIRSSMGLIRRYGLSGVDIDWRLGTDGSYLADLFEEFRGYMEPWGNAAKDDDNKASPLKDVVLTATVQAMPWSSFSADDVRRLAKHADWINVRAFDFYNSGHSGLNMPTHGAPLFQSRSDGKRWSPNVAHSVMAWTIRGLPHEKIVLGVPLFGRSFQMVPQVGYGGAMPNFSNDIEAAGMPSLMQRTLAADGNFLRRSGIATKPQKTIIRQFSSRARKAINVIKNDLWSGESRKIALSRRSKTNFRTRPNASILRRGARDTTGILHEIKGAPMAYPNGVLQAALGPGIPLAKTDLNNGNWQASGLGYGQQESRLGGSAASKEQTPIDPRVKVTLNPRYMDTFRNHNSGQNAYYGDINVPSWNTDKTATMVGNSQGHSVMAAEPMKHEIGLFDTASNSPQITNGLLLGKPGRTHDQYSTLSGINVPMQIDNAMHSTNGRGLPEGEMMKDMMYIHNSSPLSMKIDGKQLPSMSTTFDMAALTSALKHQHGHKAMDFHNADVIPAMKAAGMTGEVVNVTGSEAAQIMQNTGDIISESAMRDLMMNLMVQEESFANEEAKGGAATSSSDKTAEIKDPNEEDKPPGASVTNDESAPSDNSPFEADLDNNGVLPYSKICRMVGDGGGFQVMRDGSARASIASNGVNWISFDDQRDVATKARWSEDMGLGGIALFSLNDDDWKGKCDPNGTPFPMARTVWKMIG